MMLDKGVAPCIGFPRDLQVKWVVGRALTRSIPTENGTSFSHGDISLFVDDGKRENDYSKTCGTNVNFEKRTLYDALFNEFITWFPSKQKNWITIDKNLCTNHIIL